MFENVREIIESHYCFCQVSPYYIVSEDMPEEGVVSGRRVHAGFDLDVYGVKMSRQPDPPAEFWLVYNKLKDVVDVVRHENNHACSIAVIPFGSTVVLDTRNYLQPMAMLRIRITHNLDQRSLIIYTMIVSSILYFQRNTTGAALISSKY